MCSEGVPCEKERQTLWQLLRNVEKDADQPVYAKALRQDPTFAGRSPGRAGVFLTGKDRAEKQEAAR